MVHKVFTILFVDGLFLFVSGGLAGDGAFVVDAAGEAWDRSIVSSCLILSCICLSSSVSISQQNNTY